MTRKLVSMAAVMLVLALCSAEKAQAQGWPGGCYGYGYNGYGLAYSQRNLGFNIPYFAAFPPVYYSHIIPRPYGRSPYAWPPVVDQAVEVQEVKPAMIQNPYLQRDETAKEQADDKTASRRRVEPLVIDNPFITPTRVAKLQIQ